MSEEQKPQNLADKVVGDIKKDFTIVGKSRVHAWYAWAIVGVCVGMFLGILYVANRSGQFDASHAEEGGSCPVLVQPVVRGFQEGYGTNTVAGTQKEADEFNKTLKGETGSLPLERLSALSDAQTSAKTAAFDMCVGFVKKEQDDAAKICNDQKADCLPGGGTCKFNITSPPAPSCADKSCSASYEDGNVTIECTAVGFATAPSCKCNGTAAVAAGGSGPVTGGGPSGGVTTGGSCRFSPNDLASIVAAYNYLPTAPDGTDLLEADLAAACHRKVCPDPSATTANRECVYHGPSTSVLPIDLCTCADGLCDPRTDAYLNTIDTTNACSRTQNSQESREPGSQNFKNTSIPSQENQSGSMNPKEPQQMQPAPAMNSDAQIQAR